jgi:hypothetical protein
VIASQQNILGAIALSVFSLVGAVLLMIFISIFANKRNKRLNQQVEEEFA